VFEVASEHLPDFFLEDVGRVGPLPGTLTQSSDRNPQYRSQTKYPEIEHDVF
jgi:hypothetical protein